jgi:protein-tyrosine phosphatase
MRILFVCTGNAYRSPVAEALLKQLNPEVEVDSAGISPAIPISEAVFKYLAEEDAQRYLKDRPESYSQKNLHSYDLIVAMEERHKEAIIGRCPQCTDRIIVWNISDPYFLPQEYTRKVFDEIKTRVQSLHKSLSKGA